MSNRNTVPSTPEIEDWRDKMIQLALDAFWRYEDNCQVDPEECALICNALHDIRVRDTLVYYMGTVPVDALRFTLPILEAGDKAMPTMFAAPLRTFASMVFLANRQVDAAMEFVSAALSSDPNYSLARIIYMALSISPQVAHDALRDMRNLSYEQCRYGMNA
jgi:hypothetical protein